MSRRSPMRGLGATLALMPAAYFLAACGGGAIADLGDGVSDASSAAGDAASATLDMAKSATADEGSTWATGAPRP